MNRRQHVAGAFLSFPRQFFCWCVRVLCGRGRGVPGRGLRICGAAGGSSAHHHRLFFLLFSRALKSPLSQITKKMCVRVREAGKSRTGSRRFVPANRSVTQQPTRQSGTTNSCRSRALFLSLPLSLCVYLPFKPPTVVITPVELGV